MADSKISELPEATSVGAADLVVIVQSGTTKQATQALVVAGSTPNTGTKSVAGQTTFTGAVITTQTLTAVINHDMVTDTSALNAGTDDAAYCSFDAHYTATGTHTYDHLAGFQYRPIFTGSGAVSELRGFWSLPTHSGAGVVTNLKHFMINPPTGGGPITNQYGIFFAALTGATNNFLMYSTDQVSPCYFSSQFQIGITADQAGSAATDGHISLRGYGAAAGSMMMLGYHGTDQAGWIQASDFTHSAYAKLRLNPSGGPVCLGKPSLATNAAADFVYLQEMAGTPSGTPTAITGRIPIVVDTTGGKIWVYYGGSWKYAALT